MAAEEWALAVSSFFSGLAAGFLGGLCTIIRPMQAAMKGPEFRNYMEDFLPYASNGLGKAFNYAWSGVTTIASILALVLLFDDPGSTSFVLTAIGVGVWVVGILVVSNVWKTPTYKMILAGDPGDASGLGGDTTALLQHQLAPARDHLGDVRPLPGGPDLPLMAAARMMALLSGPPETLNHPNRVKTPHPGFCTVRPER